MLLLIFKVISADGDNLNYATNKALAMLEELQSIKRSTTIRMMGYILIKILKSKLQGLFINEHKLIMVMIMYLFIYLLNLI